MNRGLTLLAMVLALLCAAPPALADDEEGFKSLFDGKTLEGWEGDPKLWSVEDGAITGRTTEENRIKQNTFLIWRGGDVDDFELRLSYRIVGGNSGIQYRSEEREGYVVAGYQADFEAGDKFSGLLYEEKKRGVLAERGQKVVIADDGTKEVVEQRDSAGLQKHIKKEDWNDYVIIARGSHFVHKINGVVMCELTDGETAKRSMSGILALQLHVGPPMTVQFKNIRLKRLPLEGRKKMVMVSGRPSHGPGDHEFNAGVRLLKESLKGTPGVLAAVYGNGWPNDPTAFDNADAIVLYMDGGANHPLIQGDRLTQVGELMDKGVGLACLHYAVEVPKGRGGAELLRWIGGYYETGYSINPHWDATFASLPDHPVTRGVEPFKIRDEWYYNIRLREGAITPILQATPPDDTRRTPAAAENKGRSEIVAWTIERPDGGRGFGFTGGHFHKNWGHSDFRKLVLNALVWTAKAEVPAHGVESTVTEEQLKENLDKK